jgi:hypothetical protein
MWKRRKSFIELEQVEESFVGGRRNPTSLP